MNSKNERGSKYYEIIFCNRGKEETMDVDTRTKEEGREEAFGGIKL